jgi:hypothetical protein
MSLVFSIHVIHKHFVWMVFSLWMKTVCQLPQTITISLQQCKCSWLAQYGKFNAIKKQLEEATQYTNGHILHVTSKWHSKILQQTDISKNSVSKNITRYSHYYASNKVLVTPGSSDMELRCVSYHTCWIKSVPFTGNDQSAQSISGAETTGTRNLKWEKLSCFIFPTINPTECPQIGHNQAVRPVSRYLHYGTLMHLYQVQAKKLILINHIVKWSHFRQKCCASFQAYYFYDKVLCSSVTYNGTLQKSLNHEDNMYSG